MHALLTDENMNYLRSLSKDSSARMVVIYNEYASSHVNKISLLAFQLYETHGESFVRTIVIPLHEKAVIPAIKAVREARIGVRLTIISGLEELSSAALGYIDSQKEEEEKCAKGKSCDRSFYIPPKFIIEGISAVGKNSNLVTDWLLISLFVLLLGVRLIKFVLNLFCFFFRLLWWGCPLRLLLKLTGKKKRGILESKPKGGSAVGNMQKDKNPDDKTGEKGNTGNKSGKKVNAGGKSGKKGQRKGTNGRS